jgi:hypothetical protein
MNYEKSKIIENRKLKIENGKWKIGKLENWKIGKIGKIGKL